jgi:putative ABC transport system permease protein
VPVNKKPAAARLKVKVVGVFKRTDPQDPYWFQRNPFEQQFFAPERVFREYVLQQPQVAPGQYAWYFGLKSEDIQITDVIRLLRDLYTLEARAAQVIPDTQLFQGPMEFLTRYAYRAIDLQRMLLFLAVPTLAVAAYFLVVTTGMMVDGQRQEVAVLRSRGASLWQITSVYVLEGVLLAGVALCAGYPLGLGLSRLMGLAVGFLQFVDRTQPEVLLPVDFWFYGIGAAGLALMAYVGPAVLAARQSIIAYKQESARGLRKALWSRFGLDLLCLGLAGYAYYTLAQRPVATTVDPGQDATLVEPLHVLAPALFVFGSGLLLLRVLPLLAALVARVTDRWARAPLYLTLVQISRAPASYTPVVLLLSLTVGMGLYSATAARTLDRNVTDRHLYAAGADVVLEEQFELQEEEDPTTGVRQIQVVAAPPWLGHYDLPGVAHAARVRLQEVSPNVAGRSQPKAKMMAIDPADFAQVAWFRRDLAPHHINSYLNLLAQDQQAALVSEGFMQRNHLKPGDWVTLIDPNGQEVAVAIFAAVPYWPTLYPHEGDFFIVNREFIEQELGLWTYQVWLSMEEGAKLQPVIDALKAQQIQVVRAVDNRQKLIALRKDPQISGLLGGLTNGFLLAALIAVLGFWLHAAFSARSRVLQFGVLRAMGLSTPQLLGAVALEQVLVVVGGVAAGTGLGMLAAWLFVPFLQQGLDAAARTPPFLVVSAAADWLRLYGVLLVMLVAGLGGLLAALARLRIHEAVKLGEDH